MSEVRKGGVLPYLRPDGKSQVTVKYVDGKPQFITAVVVSTQHKDGIDIDTLMRPDLIEHVIRPVLPEGLYDPEFKKTKLYVNPTGKFVIGGPMGDTGLTGRKIIVDTYGGFGRHGGGCLLGQGSVEGRPLRGLCGPLRGQERGGGGIGRPLRDRARLRHRRGPSGECHGGVLRYRAGEPDAHQRNWSTATSTCDRPRSFATCGSCVPSTRRRQPMATSAAKMRISPGRAPTKRMPCAGTPVWAKEPSVFWRIRSRWCRL